MHFALYTHTATGFVLNLCTVCVQCAVSSVCFFLKYNGGTAAAHHIGIQRAIAEVSICTEVFIRTSDAEG